jgi:hypothetical protein
MPLLIPCNYTYYLLVKMQKKSDPIIPEEAYRYGLCAVRMQIIDFFSSFIGIIYILFRNKRDDIIFDFIRHINNILSNGKIPIYDMDTKIVASVKNLSFFLHPVNNTVCNTFQVWQHILNIITDGELYLVDITRDIKNIQLRIINKRYFEDVYSKSGLTHTRYYNKIIPSYLNDKNIIQIQHYINCVMFFYNSEHFNQMVNRFNRISMIYCGNYTIRGYVYEKTSTEDQIKIFSDAVEFTKPLADLEIDELLMNDSIQNLRTKFMDYPQIEEYIRTTPHDVLKSIEEY